MWKRAIMHGLGILLVMYLCLYALSECQPRRPTGFNCWRVHEGMTPAEVQALLGPGKEQMGEELEIDRENLIVCGQPAADVDRILRWTWYDGSMRFILVGFKDDRVRCKYYGTIGS
jgi:hypothetical protein